jgi:hypothetical protein
MSETEQRLKAAREAVVIQDQKQTLDFTRRLAEAGQKAMGLDLGKGSSDEMIVGDVTINQTSADQQTSAGLPKWAGLALAGLGLVGGAGALPIAGLALNYLTRIEQAAPPQVEYDPTENGIGIFRPKEVKTSVPRKATGITVVSAEWCGPCKQYKREVLDRLIREGHAVKIVINNNPNHPVPRTVFFDGATAIDEQFGVIKYGTLKKVLTP